MKFLPESVDASPVDPDWTTRFFAGCQDISNEEMQSLWAMLLSGEVTRPGTYSPRTLSVVQDMRRGDAQAFTKFATFLWRVESDTIRPWFPMLRTFEDSPGRVGLMFDDLIQLEALGLIRIDYLQGFSVTLKSPQIIQYYDAKYLIKPQNPDQASTRR